MIPITFASVPRCTCLVLRDEEHAVANSWDIFSQVCVKVRGRLQSNRFLCLGPPPSFCMGGFARISRQVETKMRQRAAVVATGDFTHHSCPPQHFTLACLEARSGLFSFQIDGTPSTFQTCSNHLQDNSKAKRDEMLVSFDG